MMTMIVAQLSGVQLGYAAVFLLTALACAGGVASARRLRHPDTRRGLQWLLAIAGLWAVLAIGRILAPTQPLQIGFYTAGLTVGFAATGAWLYFCSAFTGRTYHRRPTIRRLAGALFIIITTVKLTNPLHGRYFTPEMIAEPFPYVAISHSPLHWIVVGLAYVLAAVGFVFLFELLAASPTPSWRLGIVIGLAGLPVIFSVLGFVFPEVLLQLNYEPIGVAAFALGARYIADDSFYAVQYAGRQQAIDELSEAVLLIDPDGIVRECNTAAQELLGGFTADIVGQSLQTAVPAVADAVEQGDDIVELTQGDETRFLLVEESPLTLGTHRIGSIVILPDITMLEQQRRELRRRDEQLDDFADAITHELRNAVNIVAGHIDMASQALDTAEPETAQKSLATAERTTERMVRVIGDLATLAQHGGTLGATELCDVRAVVADAQQSDGLSGVDVEVTGIEMIDADRARLVELFEHVFRFAVENGATSVEIDVGDAEIVIQDDGQQIPREEATGIFRYGEAVPDAERGTILPTVQTLARVHGWQVEVAEDSTDGFRYRISGISTGV